MTACFTSSFKGNCILTLRSEIQIVSETLRTQPEYIVLTTDSASKKEKLPAKERKVKTSAT